MIRKKFALYVRTSRRDQNPKNQELKLLLHCQRMEWDYIIFKEQETTRKTRPVKQELLKRLREGEFDGILIWKLDRWARSLQELIMDIDNVVARGKDFVVLTQPIDTTTAAGRLFMQILGAFAEFEREMISERTIAGLDRARAQGVKLGRPRKKVQFHKGKSFYVRPRNKK